MAPQEDRRRRAWEMIGRVFGIRPEPPPAPPEPEPGAEQLGLYIDILFGEIWTRPALPPRDRSLITVALLAALNRESQLRSHLRGALNLGITQEELAEVMLHVAFYAGAPVSEEGLRVAREVFREQSES
jgi:alkylhydroperoxidase/carboxymuconolactone decarboxylase family protein YurZ